MRYFKKPFATFVLAIIFTLPAFAGNMETGVTSPPPPDSQTVTTSQIETGVTGDMQAGVTAVDSATTEAVLSLVRGLLSLF